MIYNNIIIQGNLKEAYSDVFTNLKFSLLFLRLPTLTTTLKRLWPLV